MLRTIATLSDSVATALGATDPKRWSRADWISDIVPHAVYGIVTAWTVEYLERR